MLLILLGNPEGAGTIRQEPLASPPLSDNPCDLLTATDLSAVTGLEVTAMRRVPSINKVVRAQRDGREPEPRTICSFDTKSDFGSILISVPPGSERRGELYWQARLRYFETFPGSAQYIERLGMDAWLAGGSTLRVLVRENEYLMLSTQFYQRQSRELLVKIARAILRQQQ